MTESAGDEELPNRPAPLAPITRAEWVLILVLVAIQFTHMVDFVIIMPLGDRLRHELSITPPQFGYIVAAYAWAAGVASLLATFVMDRLDRRTVLLTMYAGFGLSTLFCGLAPNYEILVLSRTLAGVFGGLAAVTLMTVIGDVFPPEKRGRASGAVMSAFAVASIVGLPIGLLLAEWFGRGAPFVALAAVSAGVWVLAWFQLPSVRKHLTAERRHPLTEFAAVAREPNHLRVFAFSLFLVIGSFTVGSFVGPVLSSINGWGEMKLAAIYLVSGLGTLIAMNVTGRFADRVNRLWLFRGLGLVMVVVSLVVTNLPPGPLWVAALVVTAYMVFASTRMVPAQAMILGAAEPRVRGAFMSLNTAVQHLGCGIAPVIAGALVTEGPDGKLTNFPLVGYVSAATALISLLLAGALRQMPQHSPATVEVPVPVSIEGEVETAAAV